jgi:hypothetical protein
MPLLEKLSSKLSSKEPSKSEKPPLTPPKGSVSPATDPLPPFNQTAVTSGDQPPTYTAQDDNAGGPSAADLSSAFSSLQISDIPTALPTPETCLAHLKLLHTIQALKEDIGYTDGLFGVWDAKAEMSETRDETLSKLREKRWALYIARAVERFETWWLKVLCPLDNSQRLECKSIDPNNVLFVQFPSKGSPIRWTMDMLPPLGMSTFRTILDMRLIIARCFDGVAFFYVEPSKLPRGLC